MSVSITLGKRIMEALLFAAEEPLDLATLQAHLPGDLHARDVLDALKEDYEGRGIRLEAHGGRYAFRTAPDIAPYLKREAVQSRRLSRAALETLAIIAYHQPVTRAEVEEIRGVSVNKGTLDLLLETGWVKPKGRRETPGRPVTWVTTHDFLDHLDLVALDDLPRIEELMQVGMLNLPVGGPPVSDDEDGTEEGATNETENAGKDEGIIEGEDIIEGKEAGEGDDANGEGENGDEDGEEASEEASEEESLAAFGVAGEQDIVEGNPLPPSEAASDAGKDRGRTTSAQEDHQDDPSRDGASQDGAPQDEALQEDERQHEESARSGEKAVWVQNGDHDLDQRRAPDHPEIEPEPEPGADAARDGAGEEQPPERGDPDAIEKAAGPPPMPGDDTPLRDAHQDYT